MLAYQTVLAWYRHHPDEDVHEAGEVVEIACEDVRQVMQQALDHSWTPASAVTELPHVRHILDEHQEPDSLAVLVVAADVLGGELSGMLEVRAPKKPAALEALLSVMCALLPRTSLPALERGAVLEQAVEGTGGLHKVDLAPLLELAEQVCADRPRSTLVPPVTELVARVARDGSAAQLERAEALLQALPEPEGASPMAPRAKELLAAVLTEERQHRDRKLAQLEASKTLLKEAPELRAEVVVQALHRHAVGGRNTSRLQLLRKLITMLLRPALPFDEAQLRTMVHTLAWAYGLTAFSMPFASVLRVIERLVPPGAAPDALLEELEALSRRLHGLQGAKYRKLAERVDALLAPADDDGDTLGLDPGPWGDSVRTWVASQPDPTAWAALLEHAATAAGRSKPSKTWCLHAADLAGAIEVERLAPQLVAWMDAAELGPHPKGSEWHDHYVRDLTPDREAPGLSMADREVLRGLVWIAAGVDHDMVPPAIARLAQRGFTKIRGYGPRSKKLGNGAVWALGQLPGSTGVAHLSRLVGKVRYGTARAQIDKALTAAAAKAGVSRDTIEEMSVPDFGLGADGQSRHDLEGFVAVLAVVGTREVTLTWETPQGKVQKSVPKAVKDAQPEALKDLKRRHKDLKEALSGQAGRVERLWLTRPEPWTCADWRRYYLDHGLLGPLTRRLLWSIDDTVVCWHDGALRRLDGTALAPPDTAEVRLWHPLTATPDQVLAWRDRLQTLEVVQPFKQAWREVYVLTPAELQTGTYSNRFAAHLIRQHPFIALAQGRAWAYTLMGPWDSHNRPHREVAGWRVEWWVDPAPTEGEVAATGYPVLSTDQVRFLRIDTHEPVPLDQVPPLVFSELMRDVDLFVSVCSLGADPRWAEGAHRAYWDDWSFGDLDALAATRAQVLGQLLPRLKIRDVAHLEDRWLVVKGKRQTYKIHLRSGNIMMDGRGYLCVVPARRRPTKGVMLPFEGDEMLSIILSKALLLANDDRITDPSILLQLGR